MLALQFSMNRRSSAGPRVSLLTAGSWGLAYIVQLLSAFMLKAVANLRGLLFTKVSPYFRGIYEGALVSSPSSRDFSHRNYPRPCSRCAPSHGQASVLEKLISWALPHPLISLGALKQSSVMRGVHRRQLVCL